MEREARAWVAELALVGIAAVWGLTFVMVQDAIAVLPTLPFLAYRFLAAALLMAGFSLRPLRALPAAGLRGGLLLGLCLTAGYLFQTFGLARTSVSNAGFITGLFVVLTPVLGALFFREVVAGVVWASAGVSAFGVYLLSGGLAGLTTGDLLVFGGALAFALHILVTSRVVARFDARALVTVQLATAGGLCLLATIAAGQLSAPRGAQVWVALAVTSVLASALGFFIQTYAQRHASPARTALILASEPAFAGFFAFWLQGERLSALAGLGAALILAAMVAVELVRLRKRPAALPA